MTDSQADAPDPETVMDGSGVPLRDFEAHLAARCRPRRGGRTGGRIVTGPGGLVTEGPGGLVTEGPGGGGVVAQGPGGGGIVAQADGGGPLGIFLSGPAPDAEIEIEAG